MIAVKPYNVRFELCVIINNMKFDDSQLDLPSAKLDEEHLKVLFTFLGFTVIVHPNLTGREIDEQIQSYSKMKHDGVFILIILSYGT